MSVESNQETIIIGGGAAGMYCAIKLQEAGRPYLLITDRMGGRIMYDKDLKMNFAAVFYFGNYKHMMKILKHGPNVLPSLRQGCCHPDMKTQYAALSLRTARHIGQLRKFQKYMHKEFIPHYEQFKSDCEVMQVKDALQKDPFIKELFYMTADQFIAKKGIQQIADDLISQFAHGCTGSFIRTLSALDYLNCVQGLVLDLKRFEFDEDAMTARLRSGKGAVEFDTVTAISKNADGTYAVTAESGARYTAKNVVLATPADVTVELVRPVVQIPRIRNASVLYAYLIRGQMKPRYQKHIVHIFADNIPIIFTAKRKEGEYEVFTEKPLDMSEYFDTFEIVKSVYWPKALFTNPNIVLDQDLGENLYMAGDHNGLGMEPAAISGIYAANRILGKA
ncbi:MAG: FAD-dependent oxidoreductase [Coriobacteriia bacterium]